MIHIIFLPDSPASAQFCPPGYIWQNLEAFLIVVTGGGEYHLLSSIIGLSTLAEMLLNILECTEQTKQQGIIWAKTSMGLELFNPAAENSLFHC